ncbi:MAG TPA: class I SAM-dependent methyltransferase [Candidatus Acidoferrales bacterium]|nr:class I SAM-dependent methyltransferase [Candidatus Acidoferrales bacterium]
MSSEAQGGLRKRIFAWALAKGNARYERAMAERKRALLGGLTGTVVEIGPGAGANLAHYAPGVQWIGVEPNPYMQEYLRREAETRGLQGELRTGTAERLGMANASVDAVVSTLVLCSVPSVAAVLKEILRVLKPGGRFVFIEHVAAPRGTMLRFWQRFVLPFSIYFADGCHPDRETGEAIETAGFSEVKLERFRAPLWLASPHVAGVAIR